MQASLGLFREAFLEALLTGDERAAELTAREAMEAGFEESAISDEIIRPSLHTVGEMWAHGLISVADEHLATEICLRVLALQREVFPRVGDPSAQSIYLAGLQGERHVVGLEMPATLLRHAAFE